MTRQPISEIAAMLLQTEKTIAMLKIESEKLRTSLSREMEANSITSLSCEGYGSVSYVKESQGSRLDTNAVMRQLEALNIPAPITIYSIKSHIKCSVNK